MNVVPAKDNLFAKIDVNMPRNIDISRLKGTSQVVYDKSETISLIYFHIKDMQYFSKIFPYVCMIQPTEIFYTELNGIGVLHPHKDYTTSCVLNYYFESNNSTTFLYEPIGDPFFAPGAKTANIFKFEDIKEVGNFTAESYDTYLLNVSKPHCVFNPPPGNRKFISWQWNNTSYEEVLENLTHSTL